MRNSCADWRRHRSAVGLAPVFMYGSGPFASGFHDSWRSAGITFSLGSGAGSVVKVLSLRARVRLYKAGLRASMAPPSRVRGFQTKTPLEFVDLVNNASNGMLR